MTKIICDHPDRKYCALGMCRPCYMVAYYANHHEERLAHNKAGMGRYHLRNAA